MRLRRVVPGGAWRWPGCWPRRRRRSGFGLNSPNAQPTNLRAGANSDLSIAIDVEEPEADLRDLTIHLPPGLVGNPLATPPCTEEQLNVDACPAASDVGDISNDIELSLLGLIDVPQTVTGNIYNVVPRAGEPARFGIVLKALPLSLPPPLSNAILAPIVLQSPAQLRQSDFGLDSVLTDLPRQATVLNPGGPLTANITITATTLNLVGKAPTGVGFLRNPTSCTPKTISFDGRAYSNETASGQAPPFTPTDCAALPFSPELKATAKPNGLGQAMELSTTISQTIEEAGLADAQVILPTGVTGSNELLGTTCPRVDFIAGSSRRTRSSAARSRPPHCSCSR